LYYVEKSVTQKTYKSVMLLHKIPEQMNYY